MKTICYMAISVVYWIAIALFVQYGAGILLDEGRIFLPLLFVGTIPLVWAGMAFCLKFTGTPQRDALLPAALICAASLVLAALSAIYAPMLTDGLTPNAALGASWFLWTLSMVLVCAFMISRNVTDEPTDILS